MDMHEVALPQALMKGRGEELFDFLAVELKAFITSHAASSRWVLVSGRTCVTTGSRGSCTRSRLGVVVSIGARIQGAGDALTASNHSHPTNRVML